MVEPVTAWADVWAAWCHECQQETMPDDLGRCLWHRQAVQLRANARTRGPHEAALVDASKRRKKAA